MRWLRRVHLYSGLLLLPWTLIYGVSAVLFNHGGGAAARTLPVPADARDALQASSAALAPELLAAIPEAGADAPTSLAGAWVFDIENDGARSHRLSLANDGDRAELRELPPRSAPARSLPDGLFDAERATATKAAERTLAAAGVAADSVRLVVGPRLRVHGSEQTWRADVGRSQLRESPASGFSLGALVRSLHVTHGYRDRSWARLAWAVIVDVMGAAMVVWAVSGIAMWWQKRSHRRAGLQVLAFAFVVAALLAVTLNGAR